MLNGTTPSGFHYTINENAKKDWRVTKALVKIVKNDSDDMEVTSNLEMILHRLLGDEQAEKLEEHIAEQCDGYIPIDVLTKELLAIFTSNNDLKNS